MLKKQMNNMLSAGDAANSGCSPVNDALRKTALAVILRQRFLARLAYTQREVGTLNALNKGIEMSW